MSKCVTIEFTSEELKLISETLRHSTELLKGHEETAQSVTDKIDRIFNSIRLLREKAKEAKKHE